MGMVISQESSDFARLCLRKHMFSQLQQNGFSLTAVTNASDVCKRKQNSQPHITPTSFKRWMEFNKTVLKIYLLTLAIASQTVSPLAIANQTDRPVSDSGPNRSPVSDSEPNSFPVSE